MDIDKNKLERYIAEKCPHVEFSAYHDELRCYWKMQKKCREFGLSIECPDSCPHLNGSVVRCTEGKCKHVKEAMKKLLKE